MIITPKSVLEKLTTVEELLYPSQEKVSLPIIYRIYKKMKHGIYFQPIHVHDNIIVDGHHKYIASVLANYPLEKILNYPMPHFKTKLKWSEISFVSEDWDSVSQVVQFNREDAQLKGISMEEIKKIID